MNEGEPLSVKIYRRLLQGDSISDLHKEHLTFNKSLQVVNKYRAYEHLDISDSELSTLTKLSWRVCHNLSVAKKQHDEARYNGKNKRRH